MKKLTFCLRRRPELTCEEFQFYWRERHAPLVLARADVLGIRRYVQVRTERNDKLHERLRVRNGGAPAQFDGIAELWYDDDWPLGVRSDKARQAARELLDDERNFIDLQNSPMTMGRELSILVSSGVERADNDARHKALRSRLVGLWTLAKWEVAYQDGRPTRYPFGDDAVGQLLYTDEGQMSVTVATRARLKLPNSSIRQVTTSQQAEAFKSLFHYAGRYEARQSAVVHHVSFSSNPNLVGTAQERAATLEDETLVLTPIGQHELPGQGAHTLTWRRAK